VWTTLAHECEFGILLARTDPSVPKHAGISMFIVDMRAPGVEVRRIHQIDGGRHFNEVFFTDVCLDPDWLLGELNNGWRQATAMLMYERVAISSLRSGKISHPMFDLLLSAAQASARSDNPVVRDQLMQIYCMETTKSLVAMRSRAELKAGRAPGPGSSIGKLASSLVARQFRQIALEIAGTGSQAWIEGDEASANLQKQLLNSFQVGIAGGTDEIQRNIIGERVLGLPREPAVDAGVPFRDLKVGTQR
jgi:alkylation response protein AidB-like acyl-CoA dehydrogenase